MLSLSAGLRLLEELSFDAYNYCLQQKSGIRNKSLGLPLRCHGGDTAWARAHVYITCRNCIHQTEQIFEKWQQHPRKPTRFICSEEFSFGVCYSYRKTTKVASLYGQEYCGTVLKCMFTVRVSGRLRQVEFDRLVGMIRLWIDLRLTWWEPKTTVLVFLYVFIFCIFFKGIKMALEKKTIPSLHTWTFQLLFGMDRKNRIQKRLRDLSFTRFSGLKIDVSTGFPMHHWRLQQQRCGFGVGEEFATGAGHAFNYLAAFQAII